MTGRPLLRRALADDAVDALGIPSCEVSILLRYQNPAHLDRPELTRFQRVPETAQKFPDSHPGLDLASSGPIDPRGVPAPVRAHPFPPAQPERRPLNKVNTVTEPRTRIAAA